MNEHLGVVLILFWYDIDTIYMVCIYINTNSGAYFVP